MKSKHICCLCGNQIAGGDVVTHDGEEKHSHALCYVKKSVAPAKKSRGNSFYNLFERSKRED